MKLKATAAAGLACAALVGPATALAHMTIEQPEAPAGGVELLRFTVPHGCDGESTESVSIEIPRTVPLAKPMVKPGWSLETRKGPKDKTELFGEKVTEGVSRITWTAEGAGLPDEYIDQFVVQVALPESEGETLYFPSVQECAKGEEAWIEIPREGETTDDLDSPAPEVILTAAKNGHGDTRPDEQSEASAGAEPAEDAGGGGDGNGLALAALVVGGLGLVTGGASLMWSRDRS